MAATTSGKPEKLWSGDRVHPMDMDGRFDLDLVLLILPEAVSVEEENISLNSSSTGGSPAPLSESESLVYNLPTVVSASSADVCPVCMEEFHRPQPQPPPPPQGQEGEEEEEEEEGRGVTKQMPCGHVYHSSCISAWLSFRRSCPLCRHLFLL